MPEITEALQATAEALKTTEETGKVIDAKVVDQPVEVDQSSNVAAAEVVEKVKKLKKEKTPKKVATEKKVEEVKEEKYSRPPLEQLTDDFENSLVDFEISGHKLAKLGYKCGKIIYGLKATTFGGKGKDFRCIAYKARKKSKSVDGKSRGIFYFGISQQKAKELCKEHTELQISTFGKCSVQSQTPVELILDRTTFTEKFGKDQDKVTKLFKVLVKATCESKKEQLTQALAKIKEAEKKAEATVEKKKKK